MTAPTNYTELQTKIADFLARSDLTSIIPDLITYGEAEINQKLRAREMISTVNINPSQVNKYVDLPTGFMELISFNDDLGNALKEVDYEDLEDLAYASGSGRPEVFSIGARIDFERTASNSLNFPMRYWKRLDIATDTTNDVLTNYPSLYIYAALKQSAPYIGDDQRALTWKAMFEDLLDDLNWRSTKNNKKLRTEFSGSTGNIITGY